MRVASRAQPPPPHAPPQAASFAATYPQYHEPSHLGELPPPSPERPLWDGSGPRFEAPGIFISNLPGPRPPKPEGTWPPRPQGARPPSGGRRRRRRLPPIAESGPKTITYKINAQSAFVPARAEPAPPVAEPVTKTIAYRTNAQSYLEPALGWPSAYPKLAIHGVEAPGERQAVGAVPPPEPPVRRGQTPWLGRTPRSQSARVDTLPPAPTDRSRSARSHSYPRKGEGWTRGEMQPPPRHEVPPSLDAPTSPPRAVGAWGPRRGGAPRWRERLPAWLPSPALMQPFPIRCQYPRKQTEDPSLVHGHDTQPFRYYHVPDPYAPITARRDEQLSYDKMLNLARDYRFNPRRSPQFSTKANVPPRKVPLNSKELDPVPLYKILTQELTKTLHSDENDSFQNISDNISDQDSLNQSCYLKSHPKRERLHEPVKKQPADVCIKTHPPCCVHGAKNRFDDTGEIKRANEVQEEVKKNWCKPKEKVCCKKEKLPEKPWSRNERRDVPPPPYQPVLDKPPDKPAGEDPNIPTKMPQSRVYYFELYNQQPMSEYRQRPIMALQPSRMDAIRRRENPQGDQRPRSERPTLERVEPPQGTLYYYWDKPAGVGRKRQEAGLLPDGAPLIPDTESYGRNKYLRSMQGVRGSKSKEKIKMPRVQPPPRSSQPSQPKYYPPPPGPCQAPPGPCQAPPSSYPHPPSSYPHPPGQPSTGFESKTDPSWRYAGRDFDNPMRPPQPQRRASSGPPVRRASKPVSLDARHAMAAAMVTGSTKPETKDDKEDKDGRRGPPPRVKQPSYSAPQRSERYNTTGDRKGGSARNDGYRRTGDQQYASNAPIQTTERDPQGGGQPMASRYPQSTRNPPPTGMRAQQRQLQQQQERGPERIEAPRPPSKYSSVIKN